jgi:hypothetical protein
MTRAERACQIWSILAWAARNRQVLTYNHISKLIGVPTAGIGGLLGPIQAYCFQTRIPPLTALVVQQETGIPGAGFTGVNASQIAQAQMEVFEFDWLDHGNPQAEKLELAMQASM